MIEEGINLHVLRPSRKKLVPGDVFVMQPRKDRFIFGRVILVDLPSGKAPIPGSNLIYIYRWMSESKQPNMEQLSRHNLLIPPIYINRLPWSKGYFETVARLELQAEDVLERHCFRRFNGDYFNEVGERLQEPVEPCGRWGLASYLVVDDEVSDALGYPRAPTSGDSSRNPGVP